MKHFNHKFAILPLLGILAMSPSVMSSKYATRGIASVPVQEEVKPEVKQEVKEESKHPKYDAQVSKVDPQSLMKDADNNFEKFKAKREDLIGKVKKEREEFKKDQSDKEIVKEQRTRVESLVIDMLLTENSLKDLQEKKGIEQADDEASQKLLAEQKDIVESLLVDLDANEVLVAKASEPKQEEPKKEEEVKVAEEKKEEPKKEEEKKEEEVKVTEEKKEEKKDDKHLCEAEEQNKVLTKQVEQLIADQKQMMNAFMGMAQMMVSMYQQQQQQAPNPYYQNGPGWNASPYQYNAPMSAGNWVYYPQGFQPQQQNIFAQPQMAQGIYPSQFHMQQQPSYGPQQNQGQWGLQPQMNFGMQQQPQGYGDPRYQQAPQFTPGSFGNEAFSYNMQPSVPMGSPALSMR